MNISPRNTNNLRTLVVCMIVFCCGLAATAEAQAAKKAKKQRVQPGSVGQLPLPVRQKLNTAFQLAVKRLQTEPTCQAMFAEFGADGVEKLTSTDYVAAPSDKQVYGVSAQGRDDNYLVAYSNVGSSQTALTELFARLHTHTAAAFLIHEALHYAGLGEFPLDPNGMTSMQITQVVAQNCDFRTLDPPAPGLTLTPSLEGR